MTFRFPAWRTTVPHLLAVSLLLLLWLTAWSAFSQGGKGRHWWWFQGNDACQGFAAQSASMRLGAPIQTVVWPGATLATPYLYATVLVDKPALPLSIESTEALLDRSVQFHWAQAGFFGLALLLLVYALGVRWSGSPALSFIASGLLASNSWFLFGLFHVRAEIPSLVLALAACWWAIAERPRAWPPIRAVVFGVLITLAVLSKIQIAPVVLLAVFLFITASRDLPCPTTAKWWTVSMWSAIALSIGGITCLVRTSAIDNTTYGLGGLPSTFANFTIALSLAALITAVLLARSMRTRVRAIGSNVLLLFGGAVLALLVLVLPIAYHGGLSAALASANRIAYGTVSFARYGQQLDAAGGWGLKSSVLDRVRSFVEFQTSSGLLSGNLALWSGVAVVSAMFVLELFPSGWRQRLAPESLPPRQPAITETPWAMPSMLFMTAVLCDVTTTHRTVSTTSYAFYHIYSLPFYLLAVAAALGQVATVVPIKARRTAPIAMCSIVVLLVSATLLSGVLISNDRVRTWLKDEGPAVTYLPENGGSTGVVWGVAPQFGTLTTQTYKSIREHILKREAAQLEAEKAKSTAK